MSHIHFDTDGAPIFTSASRIAAVLMLVGFAACDRTPRTAVTDSLLTRDLTLAASATSTTVAPSLGDTANTRSATTRSSANNSAPSAPPVTTRKVAPRSAPSGAKTRTPTDPTPVPSVAVTPAPATTSAPPIPAPAAAATNGAASGASSTGTSSPGDASGHRFGRGTALVGRTGSEICSLANRPGDRLVASLGSEVLSSDGARLPAGTPILVEMSTPEAGRDFAFSVKAVQVNGVLIPVDGTVQVAGATTDRRISKGGEKEKVIGGAIAGAILGRVLGGGAKGTVIGAAGGAAAGTVAAARSGVTEKCLPAGATLTVTLSAPLVLPPGAP